MKVACEGKTMPELKLDEAEKFVLTTVTGEVRREGGGFSGLVDQEMSREDFFRLTAVKGDNLQVNIFKKNGDFFVKSIYKIVENGGGS
jgi:hypothetical protein